MSKEMMQFATAEGAKVYVETSKVSVVSEIVRDSLQEARGAKSEMLVDGMILALVDEADEVLRKLGYTTGGGS